MRVSPSRRVMCSRSRNSSSGIAYLREIPVHSLNSGTAKRVPLCFDSNSRSCRTALAWNTAAARWAEGESMCCGGGSSRNVDQHTTGGSHQVRPGISDERARVCRPVRERHHDVTLSVATVAVPEPETWAMVLTGLGIIGFAARRKAAKFFRA